MKKYIKRPSGPSHFDMSKYVQYKFRSMLKGGLPIQNQISLLHMLLTHHPGSDSMIWLHITWRALINLYTTVSKSTFLFNYFFSGMNMTHCKRMSHTIADESSSVDVRHTAKENLFEKVEGEKRLMNMQADTNIVCTWVSTVSSKKGNDVVGHDISYVSIN